MVALMGIGFAMNAYGTFKANADQAEAEEANAAFYRDQAEFERMSGDRQRMIFDRESQVLFGEQESAFAKAGVDSSSSSLFMAKQMLFRDQESYAIKQESDFKARLAMLRADQAQKTADTLNDPMTSVMQLGGPGMQLASAL